MNRSIPAGEARPRMFTTRFIITLGVFAAIAFVVLLFARFCVRRMFFAAINDRNSRNVTTLLKVVPSLVSSEDDWGSTGLNRAIEQNDVATVRVLIERGADVNHEAVLTGTPLHDAAGGGRVEIMEELLRAGADPNRQPHKAARNSYGTPLHYAALAGMVAPVTILLDHGADINAAAVDHGGVTPLIVAITNGVRSSELVDVVKAFIASGADVNLRDADGVTPLMALEHARSTTRRAKELKILDDIEAALLASGAQLGSGS